MNSSNRPAQVRHRLLIGRLASHRLRCVPGGHWHRRPELYLGRAPCGTGDSMESVSVLFARRVFRILCGPELSARLKRLCGCATVVAQRRLMLDGAVGSGVSDRVPAGRRCITSTEPAERRRSNATPPDSQATACVSQTMNGRFRSGTRWWPWVRHRLVGARVGNYGFWPVSSVGSWCPLLCDGTSDRSTRQASMGRQIRLALATTLPGRGLRGRGMAHVPGTGGRLLWNENLWNRCFCILYFVPGM